MTLPAPPRRPAVLRAAKSTAFAIARATGIVSAARRLHRHRLPILCYHSVVEAPVLPWVGYGGLHLPLARFQRQMELVARHYRVRPLPELLAMRQRGESWPAGTLAITFDDGYANNLMGAADVLIALGLPATVFVATEYVGRGEAYWWDELRALLMAGFGREIEVDGWGHLDLRNASGVRNALDHGAQRMRAATLAERRVALDQLAARVGEQPTALPRPMTWAEARRASSALTFGGHGASHRILDGIPVTEALADVKRCREELERQLPSRWCDILCYPEGRSSPEVRDGLPAIGWSAAVTASAPPHREDLADAADDILLMPRIGISAAMDDNVFLAQLAGLWWR
jgi:peptidoglycan/xylan/chitin deacetylase (PgdA/CDA1 family)